MRQLLLLLFLFPSVSFYGDAHELKLEGPGRGKFVLHFVCTAAGDRVEEHPIVPGRQFLSNPADLDTVNSRLQWVYDRYGIECYFLLMEYFDLKISASSAQHQSLDSLFGNGKFYSKNSLIDTMRRFQNETGKWMKQAVATAIDRPVILVNIARYHTVYSDSTAVNYYLSLHYAHKPGSIGLPENFDDIYRNFLERASANNLNGAHLFNETLVLDYAKQWIESAVKVTLQKQILQTFSSAGLKNILKYFEQGDIDYKKLSLQERLHCLSVFAGENMYGATGIITGEEEYALWILEHTPVVQIVSLLNGLNAPSVLNGNPLYPGDQNNTRCLIERLISGIDGDNYAQLQKCLIKLMRKDPGYGEKLTRLFSDQPDKRIFSWNDSWMSTPVVGHVKYLVSYVENGSLKVVTKRVEGVVTSVSSSGNVIVSSISYADEPEISLNNFEPVLFLSNCELPAFSEAGADKGVPLIVPAIFLKYAQDKEWNDDLITAASVTGDLVTLAAAPLAWTKALSWTRKAWIAFEAANALGNLSINTLGSDLPPEFNEIVQKSNYLMLAVGGKNILKGGYASFSLALAGTKDVVTKISRELAQQLARSLLEDASPGFSKLEKLSQLSSTSASADAITKFYSKLKALYKDSFNKDLELDLTPISPSVLPDWVSEIRTVEDYLGRVPAIKRQEILDAFESGTIELVICQDDFDLIRHISQNGYKKSYWYAKNLMSPEDARKFFALPNTNTAEYISVSRIRKGTPCLKGKVASQISSIGFGNYATGGGEQYFFLKELWEDDNLIKVIEDVKPNPLDS